MPLRKTFSEAMVVVGDSDGWLRRCEHALVSQGFTSVQVDPNLKQVCGNYKQPLGLAGDVHVTVTSEGSNTRLYIRVSANVDGLHARMRRPTTKLLEKFREG